MRNRSLLCCVALFSLWVGACATTVPVNAVSISVVSVPPEAPPIEIASLPLMSLRLDELLMPPQIVELPRVVPVVEVAAGCDLAERIRAARALLEPIPLAIGTRTYRYTERRAGSKMTFKDPEKTIALALMNASTCELQATVITKRGNVLIAPPEFSIRPVTRSNGIQWNNWATEFRIEKPEGLVVVLLKYPYARDPGAPMPLYYTPYSMELHMPELVRAGRTHLDSLAARVYADLRMQDVPSLAIPGRLVADVEAVSPEFVTRLAPIEHMDLTEFLLDPAWTTERIHIVIGANLDRVATHTCSKAKACGLMQFTKKTYGFMRKLYPAADLIANFEEGARDQYNAMKAAALLHDYNTAQLIEAFGGEILEDPRLEEYLGAAYNTGVGRVIAVVTIAKKAHMEDWTEARGTKKTARLVSETKGYIAKLRFLRDQWQAPSIARVDNKTPDH